MIGGYAMHGHGKEALKHSNGCMKKVYSQIMSPLLVFLSEPVAMQVWWTKGLHCDASMSTVYMISTKLEHYSSMVELLGCALQLFLQSSFLSFSFNLLLEIPIGISCIHTCLIGEHT
jgi:hypothetical protein